MATYGATYEDVEREMRAFAAGSLASMSADVDVWIGDAAAAVDEALVGVGYDPAEVAGRASTDSLYRLCNRAVALLAAANTVASLNAQDTQLGASLFARAQAMIDRIKQTPYQVSPDTWDSDEQTGGSRVSRKRSSSDRPFWRPGRRL